MTDSLKLAAQKALAELLDAKQAHEDACRQWGIDNPPMRFDDPRRVCDSGDMKMPPAPAINAAVARLNAAWKAARSALQHQEEREVYVECRECGECGHAGINDSHPTDAACNSCDWRGPSPKEDHCPDCHQDGTMTAACPKCGCGRYTLVADTTIVYATPPLLQKEEGDGKDAVLHLDADGEPVTPARLAGWLDIKFSRHGEEEDKWAADYIRAAAIATRQGEKP